MFKGETFYPIASLTKTVPVLSVGAISKRYDKYNLHDSALLMFYANACLVTFTESSGDRHIMILLTSESFAIFVSRHGNRA